MIDGLPAVVPRRMSCVLSSSVSGRLLRSLGGGPRMSLVNMDPIEKIVEEEKITTTRQKFIFFLLSRLLKLSPRPAEPAHRVVVVRLPDLPHTAAAARPARADRQKRAAEAQRPDGAVGRGHETVAFERRLFARLVVFLFFNHKLWC